ncbi:Glutamyl-tRNA synthetase [Dinochytrium kinnereticum]|nr:Glutamyl-tRNA synthetase [Dinochytrium kinnereticum]
MAVRVRFAPSPTGYLHLGGLRTALFNYLFAKRYDGKFILRIEDTDRAHCKTRTVPDAAGKIMSSLKWVGLKYDEGLKEYLLRTLTVRKGPDIGGLHSPYTQSERSALYRDHAEKLLESGHAYRCFCTRERLASLKEDSSGKLGGGYDRRCRFLSTTEIRANTASGKPYSIRLKIPEGKTTFKDGVYGRVSFSNKTLDDGILFKTDGHATYHLANVVDDKMMGVTHVLRGENQDFLPSAILTFAASMGMSLPSSKSLYTLDELVKEFSVERLQKAPAVVSYDRLLFLNKMGLINSIDADYENFGRKFRSLLEVKFPSSATSYDNEYIHKVLQSSKERARTIPELLSLSTPFFSEPDLSSIEAVEWRKSFEVSLITPIIDSLEIIDKNAWAADSPKVLKDVLSGPHSKIMNNIVRYSVAGMKTGPKLSDMVSVLGKDIVLKRLRSISEVEAKKLNSAER